MKPLRALIRLSFLEFLRDRIVWVALFVAILMFGFSVILGTLSFNERQRILSHLGLAVIQISTLGMGLILSANWLHKEMDRQTCLLVLARPVSRNQFLLGKFLPILALVLTFQAALGFCLWALLGFSYPLTHFLQVLVGTFLEVAMVCSLSFMAAVSLRPTIAFFIGVSVFLVGHWIQEIEFFGRKFKIEMYENLAATLKWLWPNLYQFNWRSTYFLENGVPSDQIVWALVHALGWAIFSVAAAILIFRRKDLV
jgi:Cu-processing system permease protein